MQIWINFSWRTQETISEDNVRSICNGILSQGPGQIGIIRVHQVQAVDWWKRLQMMLFAAQHPLLKVGRGHHIR